MRSSKSKTISVKEEEAMEPPKKLTAEELEELEIRLKRFLSYVIWKKKEEEEEEEFKRKFVKHAKNEHRPTEQARKETLQEINGWFHKNSDIAEEFQRPVGNLAVKAIMQRNNGGGLI